MINFINIRRMKWNERFSEEDMAFIKRFVLASGSLKAMAEGYGISYPTVRLRLDRLIQRIRIFDSETITSEFERVLRAQFADGKIDQDTFKQLLAAHQRELRIEQMKEISNESTDHSTGSDAAPAVRRSGGGR
jgi:hypothetical protein